MCASGETMLDNFTRAIAELTWRYSSADAAMGIRAQSTEGGGGGRPFDAAASARLHDDRLSEGWSSDLRKRERIDATLTELSSSERRILDLAFTPPGRCSEVVDAYFTIAGVRLFGLAMVTSTARGAFEKRKPSRPTGWTVVDWFEEHQRSLEKMKDDLKRLRDHKPSHGVFDGVLNEAVRMLAAALASYDERRRERVGREQEAIASAERARKATDDAEKAATRRRLFGDP